MFLDYLFEPVHIIWTYESEKRILGREHRCSCCQLIPVDQILDVSLDYRQSPEIQLDVAQCVVGAYEFQIVIHDALAGQTVDQNRPADTVGGRTEDYD